MVTAILIILALIIGIPVALMVVWQLLKFFWALLCDLAGIIVAIIIIGIISWLVFLIV